MSATVVTEQAIVVAQAEEGGCSAGQHGVVSVLDGAHGGAGADGPVHRTGGVVVVVAAPRNGFVGDVAEGFVLRDGRTDPGVKRVAAFELAVDVGSLGVVLEQVAEPQGPAVYEFRGIEQPLDGAVPLVGGGVGQEGANLIRGGEPSGEIQSDAAEELGVRGQRRRRDPERRQAPENFVVNEVAARDLVSRHCGSGQDSRTRLRECADTIEQVLAPARLPAEVAFRVDGEGAVVDAYLLFGRRRRSGKQNDAEEDCGTEQHAAGPSYSLHASD